MRNISENMLNDKEQIETTNFSLSGAGVIFIDSELQRSTNI